MRSHLQRLATPALAYLILSSLALGGANQADAAVSWTGHGLALSPDGQRAYLVDPLVNGVAVLDTASHQLIDTIKVDATALAVSPDATRLYAANGNRLSIISLATGQALTALTLGDTKLALGDSIAVSPDGQRVYVANYPSSAVAIVDPIGERLISTVGVGLWPNDIFLHPATQRLYVANRGGRSISVVDTGTNSVVETLYLSSFLDTLAVSPDGRTIYVSHEDGPSTMILLTTETWGLAEAQNSIPGGNSRALVVSPDSKQLFMLSNEFPIVAAIDLKSGGVSKAAALGPGLVSLVLSPDGKYLYTIDTTNGAVLALDPKTLQVTAPIDVKKKPSNPN